MLGQQLRYDFAADIRQPEVASEMPVGEAFVVQAETVQDGRLEVVDMHAVLHDLEAEFVRFSDDLAAFDSAARHPQAEAVRMMVAADGRRLVRSANLGHWGAAEFPAPHDQRVF